MKNTPPDGVIRMEVDKGSEPTWEKISPEMIVGGVPWKACVSLNERFSVGLRCVHSQSTPWFIDVDAEITLVHPDIKKNETSEFSHTYRDCMPYRAVDNDIFDRAKYYGKTFASVFHFWDTEAFINNELGFIKDGKITAEIRFWISKMRGIRLARQVDFTDSNELKHDVVFVVQGEKIHASKQTLASNSSVLNAMFDDVLGDKESKEIELKNVDREEFIELLRVIGPPSKHITDDSVEFLLKLSDRFQIESVKERAEDFVIKSKTLFIYEKLAIADQYRLFALQVHCFSELKTLREVRDMMESYIYRDLSNEMKIDLLELHLEMSL